MVEIQKLEQSLDSLTKVAKAAQVYPVDQSVAEMKKLLEQVNQVMIQVETRTTNTEWESVPLIGASSASSSRLKSVQQEVIHHLKNHNQSMTGAVKDVSSWDVAREFRDSLEVGSCQHVEAVRASLQI